MFKQVFFCFFLRENKQSITANECKLDTKFKKRRNFRILMEFFSKEHEHASELSSATIQNIFLLTRILMSVDIWQVLVI